MNDEIFKQTIISLREEYEKELDQLDYFSNQKINGIKLDEDDVIILKMSLNRKSDDYISPEILGKMMRRINEKLPYHNTVIAIPTDYDIKDKETVIKMYEMALKNLKGE